MAQDLQKVFPNAVKTGKDGYLKIRHEDMFYAMINAIKELDKKITDLVQVVKNNTSEIAKLKSVCEQQKKTIETQQKAINELSKRLDKLEKQK